MENIENSFTKFEKELEDHTQEESSKDVDEMINILFDTLKEEKSDRTKENKQYDFMDFIVNDLKSISYMENVFQKLPQLVNARNQDNKPIFFDIIRRYLSSIYSEDDEEDFLYYGNLISLFLFQEYFHLSHKEKKAVLNEIFQVINHLYHMKKNNIRRMNGKIGELKHVVQMIRNTSQEAVCIDDVAQKYGVSIHFPNKILEELELPNSQNREKRYMPKEHIITVDKKGTVEIDDGISCRKLENGCFVYEIHIASPLAHFPYQSPIIQEALSRGASINLPRCYRTKDNEFVKMIPMFPIEFIKQKASLKQGMWRDARSYIFVISPEGEIILEKFLKTRVYVNRQMTFKGLDKVLEHGTRDAVLQKTVNSLQEVTEVLDKIYHPKEYYEFVKENTEDYTGLRVRQIGAEKIVNRAMLLTGNRVAEFFYHAGIPCPYRVFEIPDDDIVKIHGIMNHLQNHYGDKSYQRLFSISSNPYLKGWYAPSGEHEGLGLEHCCHCTSELRRAPDIIVDYGLEIGYDKEPTDQELQELEKEVDFRTKQINAKLNSNEWFIKECGRTYQKKR